MEKIKDIHINIGKEKIQSGVIFLFGSFIGGATVAIAMRTKIKARVEEKEFKRIEEIHKHAAQSMNRACSALTALEEKTKILEKTYKENK